MDFINLNELSLLDKFSLMDTVGAGFSVFFAVFFLAVMILIILHVIKAFSDGDIGFGIAISFTAILFCAISTASFSAILDSGVTEAKKQNIEKVFEVPEDQSYSPSEEDLTATIKDEESQTIYDVTFGFNDSGEPFIYETGTVNKEFIESIKK